MNRLKLTSIAFVVGLIWGCIAISIVAAALIFTTGDRFVPDLGAAALSSAGGAIAVGLSPRRLKFGPTLSIAAALSAILYYLLSGLRPFGTIHESRDMLAVLGIGLFSLGCNVANFGCLSETRERAASRYNLELVLVRSFKGLGLVVFTLMVALPFYVMLMTSLKSQQSLISNPLDFSIGLGRRWDDILRSYIELFRDFDFGVLLANSAIVSIATVIITLLLAIPGAYAVARLKFSGQAALSNMILLIYMIPAIVLVIPLYAVFSQAGLRNSLTGLMIVYPATTIPVALYMLQGYFRGLPFELEEAGLMDGLSRLGVILKITLPLSLPAIASVSLYVFMIAWNEFLFAFMFLDDPSVFTLSRGVVSLNSSEVPRQHLMAGAVVATVPVLLVFLWFERFLVSGLTAGSVKG